METIMVWIYKITYEQVSFPSMKSFPLVALCLMYRACVAPVELEASIRLDGIAIELLSPKARHVDIGYCFSGTS
jgi:hypothetical protein